jgi:tetratricopeptide (TPR) repeat protein
MPEGVERLAVFRRAKSEVERAQALGDKSPWLQIMLEEVRQDPNSIQVNKDENMRKAEAAFAKGDYDAAIVSYKALAGDDPKSYQAPLFVGDMYFRKHDAKSAGEWFQKAIDINPNIETAYRYWGDALFTDGDKDAALQKFIDAIVADPYNRKSWMGLTQWAQNTGTTLAGPKIKLPQAPTPTPGGKKGDLTITIDPATIKDTKAGSAAWLMYGMTRTLWRNSKFAKEYPNEKEYRHSLGEEADALHMVLLSLKEQKIPADPIDPSFHDLLDLGNAGMIEPFVLLSIPDQEIAKDYAAYRAQHRDLLHAYIEKYLVHRNSQP